VPRSEIWDLRSLFGGAGLILNEMCFPKKKPRSESPASDLARAIPGPGYTVTPGQSQLACRSPRRAYLYVGGYGSYDLKGQPEALARKRLT
jgi:hypothetical protein